MPSLNLKPTHAPVKKYYATLERFARGHFDKEGNIRGAFEDLLKHCARQYDWTLIPEYSIPRKGPQSPQRRRQLSSTHSISRAAIGKPRTTKDSLKAEMKKKFEAGYPRSNILFQRPDWALLFQDGRIAFHGSIEDPQKLVDVLRHFFEWRQPDHDSWDRAATEFSERIPQIASGAMTLIQSEKKTNRALRRALRRLRRALPRVHQPRPQRRSRRRDARPAPAHRAHLPPHLQQSGVHPPQRHRRRNRESHRLAHQPPFQPRRIPPRARPLLQSHRSRPPPRSRTTPKSSDFLNTIYERFFQSFNTQAGRHPRHRLHPAAHRRFHGPQRRGDSQDRIRPQPQRQRRSHPRPLRRHRQLHHPRHAARSKPAASRRSTRKNCTATKSCCCPTTSPA